MENGDGHRTGTRLWLHWAQSLALDRVKKDGHRRRPTARMTLVDDTSPNPDRGSLVAVNQQHCISACAHIPPSGSSE